MFKWLLLEWNKTNCSTIADDILLKLWQLTEQSHSKWRTNTFRNTCELILLSWELRKVGSFVMWMFVVMYERWDELRKTYSLIVTWTTRRLAHEYNTEWCHFKSINLSIRGSMCKWCCENVSNKILSDKSLSCRLLFVRLFPYIFYFAEIYFVDVLWNLFCWFLLKNIYTNEKACIFIWIKCSFLPSIIAYIFDIFACLDATKWRTYSKISGRHFFVPTGQNEREKENKRKKHSHLKTVFTYRCD